MSSAEHNADGDGDGCLSMVDVLAEQARLQEDASAVLGDSDESDCTYAKGYVQRQALYACSTCSPSEPAGICLACSYKCHEGHDLYELYTKRFFRCDCGNSKFENMKCKLIQDKEAVNKDNKYNQNFKGSYCTCFRPYPDPDDEVEDEMIQCVVCEDWYHGRHLNASVPDNEDYQEMICGGCMDKHAFLSAYYLHSAVTVKAEPGLEQQDVHVGGEREPALGETDPPVAAATKQEGEQIQEPANQNSTPNANRQDGEEKREAEATAASGEGRLESLDDDDQPAAKRMRLENSASEPGVPQEEVDAEPCLLSDLRKRQITPRHGGAFWPAGWREKLCRCARCSKSYEEEGVQFLLDEADTVHAYEERGRSRMPTVTDSELEQNALSGMNRMQQVEVLQGFQDLKTELREFLKGFADSGKVVGEEDIRVFFSRMEARKQERRAGMQYHCK